ncbi:hypothetical protein D3C86_1823310 [compost metagenome]
MCLGAVQWFSANQNFGQIDLGFLQGSTERQDELMLFSNSRSHQLERVKLRLRLIAAKYKI